MNKPFIIAILLFIFIPSLTSAYSWNEESILINWSCVDLLWNHPYPYGLNIEEISIKPSYFMKKGHNGSNYGNVISSQFQITDNLDFLSRILYSTVVDTDNNVENAVALSQIIINRMKVYNLSIMDIVSEGYFKKNKYFFDPSQASAENKEYLYIHCCYLAKSLLLLQEVPLCRQDGNSVFPSIGNATGFVIFESLNEVETSKCKNYLIIGNVLYYSL